MSWASQLTLWRIWWGQGGQLADAQKGAVEVWIWVMPEMGAKWDWILVVDSTGQKIKRSTFKTKVFSLGNWKYWMDGVAYY